MPDRSRRPQNIADLCDGPFSAPPRLDQSVQNGHFLKRQIISATMIEGSVGQAGNGPRSFRPECAVAGWLGP